MSNINKKPYELSVWKDVFRQEGEFPNVYSYYDEQRLGIIGSDIMETPAAATDVILTENINGSITCTFSMYTKYFDNEIGDYVDNPFFSWIKNESKVKLWRGDDRTTRHSQEWLDLIVKDINESSTDYKFSITCTSLAVNELSKNGYNIEFDETLQNNYGDIQTLATTILEGSDWELDSNSQSSLKQTVEENLYSINLRSGTSFVANYSIPPNTQTLTKTITNNYPIYLYYSTIANLLYDTETTVYFQFLEKDGLIGDPDINGNIQNADAFYVRNVLLYKYYDANNNTALRITINNNIIFDDTLQILIGYRGKRYVRSQQIFYDINTSKIISVYEKTNSEDIYHCYTDVDYVTSQTAINFLVEGDDFTKVINDNSTWIPQTNKSNIKSVILPEVNLQTEILPETRLTALKADFLATGNCILNTSFKYNYTNIFSSYNDNNGTVQYTDLEEKTRLAAVIKLVNVNGNTITDINQLHIGMKILQDGELETNTLEITPSDFHYSSTLDAFIADTENIVLKKALLIDNAKKNKIQLYITTNSVGTAYINNIKLFKYATDSAGNTIIPGSPVEATTITTYSLYNKNNPKQIRVETVPPEEWTDSTGTNEGYKLKYYEDYTKIRSITESKSNRYNLLQTLCENFECWLKFRIEHNTNGTIKLKNVYDGDIIINKIPEKYVYFKEYVGIENYIGFKYQINLDSINRTLNSDQIVSKLIVEDNTNEYGTDGLCSIARASENRWRNNFILDFNYYISQGLLNETEVWNDLHTTTNGYIGYEEQYSYINRLASESRAERLLMSKHSVPNLEASLEVADSVVENAEENFQNENNTLYSESGGHYYEDLRVNHKQIAQTREDGKDPLAVDYIKASYDKAQTYLEYKLKYEAERRLLYKEIGIKDAEYLQEYPLAPTIYDADAFYCVKYIVNDNIYYIHDNTVTSENYDERRAQGLYVRESYRKLDNTDSFITNERYYTYNSNEQYYWYTKDNSVTAANFAQKVENGLYINLGSPLYTKIRYNEKFEEYQKTKLIDLDARFYKKYARFIQEGTWISEDYYDDNLYYLDAQSVMYTSRSPEVTYDIKVAELSQTEDYQLYKFSIGDKTWIEDTEFFGWTHVNGVKTPYKEEIVISEITWNLDDPSQNTVTVQNYKTQFEDLFQRITATTQSLEYKTGAYDHAANAVNSDGTIESSILQRSIESNQIVFTTTADNSIKWDNTGITVTNVKNPKEMIRIVSGGFMLSTDGGSSWHVGLTANGISANSIKTGRLDASMVNIYGSSTWPTFRWDDTGLNAYRFNYVNGQAVDFRQGSFVRFDQFGIYGLTNQNAMYERYTPAGDTLNAKLGDIIENSSFGLIWDNFFMKGNGNGHKYVSISKYEDIQVIDGYQPTTDELPIPYKNYYEKVDENYNLIINPDSTVGLYESLERIKIGALDGNGLYGIKISNQEGRNVLISGSDGNLWLQHMLKVGGDSSIDPMTTIGYNPSLLEPIEHYVIQDYDNSATTFQPDVEYSLKSINPETGQVEYTPVPNLTESQWNENPSIYYYQIDKEGFRWAFEYEEDITYYDAPNDEAISDPQPTIETFIPQKYYIKDYEWGYYHQVINANSNFLVYENGKIYATDADIEGKIIATEGQFTGSIYAKNGYLGESQEVIITSNGLDVHKDNRNYLTITGNGMSIVSDGIHYDYTLINTYDSSINPYYILDGTNYIVADPQPTAETFEPDMYYARGDRQDINFFTIKIPKDEGNTVVEHPVFSISQMADGALLSMTGNIEATSGSLNNIKIGTGNNYIHINDGKIYSSNYDLTNNTLDYGFLINSDGSIRVNNITLGSNANIYDYIQLGDSFIYNPDKHNDNFISANNGVVNIKNDGRANFGDIYINGINSTIGNINQSWEITPDTSTFNNIYATGKIYTSVFESSTTRAAGGEMLFKDAEMIKAYDTLEEENYILASTFNETVTYYIKENDIYILADPQPTSETFTTNIYYTKEINNYSVIILNDISTAFATNDFVTIVGCGNNEDYYIIKDTSIETIGEKDYTTIILTKAVTLPELTDNATLINLGNKTEEQFLPYIIGINSTNAKRELGIHPNSITFNSISCKESTYELNEQIILGRIPQNLATPIKHYTEATVYESQKVYYSKDSSGRYHKEPNVDAQTFKKYPQLYIVSQLENQQGLYASNVYLTGQLTTEVPKDVSLKKTYAGINTSSGIGLSDKIKSQMTALKSDDSEIVFWAGAESAEESAIQDAPFLVTALGNFIAKSGLFEGSIFIKNDLEVPRMHAVTILGDSKDTIEYFEDDLFAITLREATKGIDYKNNTIDTKIMTVSSQYVSNEIYYDEHGKQISDITSEKTYLEAKNKYPTLYIQSSILKLTQEQQTYLEINSTQNKSLLQLNENFVDIYHPELRFIGEIQQNKLSKSIQFGYYTETEFKKDWSVNYNYETNQNTFKINHDTENYITLGQQAVNNVATSIIELNKTVNINDNSNFKKDTKISYGNHYIKPVKNSNNEYIGYNLYILSESN